MYKLILSFIVMMAFTLSGYAVADPYSPVQGEVPYENAIQPATAIVIDMGVLRPDNDGRTLQSPEAVTLLSIESDASAVVHSADIKGMAKPEVGWRVKTV